MRSNDPQFPTLYNKGLRVYHNHCGEIFVEQQNGVTIRIGSYNGDCLIVTAHGSRMSPWASNGLPAFVVSK